MLLKYLLWENTAIIRWPPPLLPLICRLSFHELDINVSKAILFIQRFLNVAEYSEAVAKITAHYARMTADLNLKLRLRQRLMVLMRSDGHVLY